MLQTLHRFVQKVAAKRIDASAALFSAQRANRAHAIIMHAYFP